MFDYCQDLYRLQIELSTVCNSLCLGCVRTDLENFNHTKDYIPRNKYLDVDVLIQTLESEAGRRIEMLEFCGNIDEPLAHPRLLEMLEHLVKTRPELVISIHTNGGLGTPEKFKRIAQLMREFGPQSNFRFSLDGLEDTNHLYRQNVRWDRAIANMRAAASEGAQIIWQFLVFPWNRHQVDEAQALAKEIGCTEFWVRPDRSLATEMGIEKIHRLKEIDRPSKGRPEGSISGYRTYAKNRDKDIVCSFRNNGMLFLSWEGKIWPCCFISNVLYESKSKIRMFEKHFVSRYPENFNSLYHRSLGEILDGPLFRKDLVQSWSTSASVDKMKWRCVEKCSSAKIRSSDGKADDRNHLAHVKL